MVDVFNVCLATALGVVLLIWLVPLLRPVGHSFVFHCTKETCSASPTSANTSTQPIKLDATFPSEICNCLIDGITYECTAMVHRNTLRISVDMTPSLNMKHYDRPDTTRVLKALIEANPSLATFKTDNV